MNKKTLIEKSPPNLIKMRMLQALFPNSYFLIVQRHPLAVALSTIFFTRRFTGTPNMNIDRLLSHWLHCHKLFEEDRVKIKKLFTYDLEHFTSEPKKIIQAISQFIGEPIKLLNNFEIHPTTNEKYFNDWQRAPENQKQALIDKHEKALNEFGYSLVDLDK